MCGRFMLDMDVKNILEEYGTINQQVGDYKLGDIYPSEKSIIVLKGKGRILQFAKWGFPLTGKSRLVINARSESISHKAMFKDAFENSRCIIPAKLFYEWKAEASEKIKHKIYLKSGEPISFGGICKFTLNNRGEKGLSFVIITTESNHSMVDLHPRMPLIVEDDHINHWLDKNTEKTIIEEIIESNSNHEFKIEKVEEDKAFEQMRLF